METDAISQSTRLARCWEKCSKTSQLTLLDSLVWNLTIFKNCIDPWQPYRNGTIYVSQVPVTKAWPTCAPSSTTVTQTKLSSGSGVSRFLRERSPDCKLQMPVSHSEGWQQLATAPTARNLWDLPPGLKLRIRTTEQYKNQPLWYSLSQTTG